LAHPITRFGPNEFPYVPFYTLAYSPDGETLRVAVLPPSAVSGPPYRIELWNGRSKKLERTLSSGNSGRQAFLSHLALSSDGKTAAVARPNGDLQLWQMEAPKDLKKLNRTPSPTQWTMTTEFSPDGQTLLESRGDGGNFVKRYAGRILLWDAHTGQLQRTLNTGGNTVLSFLLSPDGQTVIGNGIYALQAWDARTSALLYKTGTPYNGLAALSPDGRTLATRDAKRNVVLRDARTGAARGNVGGKDGVNDLTFAPDSQTLATVSNQFKLGFPLASGKNGALFADGPIRRVPTQGEISLWDVATRARVRTFKNAGKAIGTALFSPDGQVLAAASENQTVLWNAQTGALLRRLSGHTQPVIALAFAPDGRTLATGDEAGKVLMWRLK